MYGLQVIRSIIKNWWLVLLFPAILGTTVFYLTRHENKIYDCKMTIYTGISAAKVGVGEGTKLDFYTANNAMDNLISIFKGRNTIQSATIQLLAMHLSLLKHDPAIINWKNYEELKQTVPDSLRKLIVMPGDALATTERIKKHLSEFPDGQLAKLFFDHPHYGIDPILEKIKANRRASSDMIDISFESDDAAICMYTLKLLAEAYFLRYREMKRAQNASAVEYFEAQLRVAGQKLKDSEEILKEFISSNRILNYYEQGKSLFIYEKEEEQEEQTARQLAVGADNALKKIEVKLSGGKDRTQIIDSLAILRNTITETRSRLNAMLINKLAYTDEIAETRKKIQDLYTAISEQVAQLYQQDYSIDGIPANQLINEWLILFTEREKQLSYQELVTASKNMVSDRIEAFAPLGAELKRMERSVSVNESQYLSILNGLNLANLQRQSVEQASVQELIDEPFIPGSARKGKRIVLVIASVFVGLLSVVGAIIAKVILDGTLKNASVASEKTGMKVISCYPWHKGKKPDAKLNETIQIANNQLINELIVKSNDFNKPLKNVKICVYETFMSDNSAKTVGILKDKLIKHGYVAEGYWAGESTVDGVKSMPIELQVLSSIEWTDLPLESSGEDGRTFVIAGFPALNKSPFPARLMNSADIVIVVANASRQWKDIDRELLSMVETTHGNKPLMVLNEVDPNHIKDFFGSIPFRSFVGRNRKMYQ